MKTYSCRLLSSILLFIVLFCLSACMTPTSQRTDVSYVSKQPKLKVGISTNAPPFVYKTPGGKTQGLEIELAEKLGRYLNREVEFVEMAWEKQLPALEEGTTDIVMSGMTITAKRQYRAAFTKPYMKTGQILLVRTSERGRYQNGVYSLMGRNPKIGTVQNTTGELFIIKTINRPDKTSFATSLDGVKALGAGEIDVLVHDAPILCYYAATYDKAPLTPILQMGTEEYIGWAVNKSNSELLKAANEFIAANAASGQLQESIHRWVPFH